MEASFNIQAIILDKKDFREADSRIICYCPDRGKLELVARGSKKLKSKLAGHTEPLTLVNLMVIVGKDYNYAGTGQGENFFPEIKNDLEKIKVAGQALNLVNKMTREGELDGQYEIFNLLKSFLESLENNSPLERGGAERRGVSTRAGGYEEFLKYFEKELIKILGFSREDFEELINRGK
jgi:DNA repair protein RecO (recombination protein O)